MADVSDKTLPSAVHLFDVFYGTLQTGTFNSFKWYRKASLR